MSISTFDAGDQPPALSPLGKHSNTDSSPSPCIDHSVFLLVCLETGSHSIAQFGPKLWIFLTHSPEHWNCRYRSPPWLMLLTLLGSYCVKQILLSMFSLHKHAMMPINVFYEAETHRD